MNESEGLDDPIVDCFNVCGCYDTGVVKDWLRVLALLKQPDPKYITDIVKETGLSYNYVRTILHLLDDAGLTEHGTAIRGCWITSEGEKWLPKIESFIKQMEAGT